MAIAMTGCSDSPEGKAAKELRRATQRAIEVAEKGPSLKQVSPEGDGAVDYVGVYAQARSELKSALTKANVAGDAAAPAWLAHGNLCFAQVRQMKAEIHRLQTPVSDVADELTTLARQISELQLRQEQIRQSVNAIENETSQLTELLEGTPEKKGLGTSHSEGAERLADLQRQRERLIEEQKAALERADDIQRQVDEKQQAAQLSAGDERMALLKTAFELMREKTRPLIEAQEAADQIKIVDEQMTLLRPTVLLLAAQIDATAKRIEDLKKSPELQKIESGNAETDEQIRKYAARVDWLVDDLKKGLGACLQQTTQMTDLLDTAISDYGKVRVRPLKLTAALRIADANFWKASIAADRLAFDRHISARLHAIAAGQLGSVSDTLNNVADAYCQLPEAIVKMVLDDFDRAIDGYAALPESDKAAKEIMAAQVLALYGKALFADRIDRPGEADEAIVAADKVMEQIKKIDPVFFTSVTAQLLNPSSEFIPPMSVDLSATYEEFKRQFQDWKQMRGEEQRAEVERLLMELDSMPPPRDPQEFERIMGPERLALEAQMAKGFDEPTSSDLSDPNNFF